MPTRMGQADTATTVRPGGARATSRHGRWWAPAWVVAWLACLAWPIRWALDTPTLHTPMIPWLWGVWGLVSLIAAAVIATRVTHRQERVAAGLALAATDVWLHAVWWAWAGWHTLMAWWGVGIILACGAQALNGRQWERHRIDARLRAWPMLMEGTPWADLRPVGQIEQLSAGVRRLRYRRKDAAHTSLKELMDEPARTRYEERHHLPHGSIRVERDGRSVDDVLVTEVTTDPHAGHRGVEWDGTVLRSAADDLVIAYHEDGQPVVTTFFRHGFGVVHRLIAGVTGSGKSTLMRLLAMSLAPAEDAIVMMIDAKGGMSFSRIAALFGWFTVEVERSVRKLERFVELMHQRQRESAARGEAVWRLSSDAPIYVLFIDEIAKLVGEQAPNSRLQSRAQSALIQLVQEGRAAGISLCVATQYPTVSALGSSQFRSQIDWRACFRMAEEGHSDVILTKAPKGVDAAGIDDERGGTCYIQAGSKCRPVTARVLNVPDGTDDRGQPDADVPDMVTPFVRRWWQHTIDIPRQELDVLDREGDFYARTIYGPDGETWVEDPEFEPGPCEPGPPHDDTPVAPVITLTKEPTVTPDAGNVSFSDLTTHTTATADEQAADAAALARIRPHGTLTAVAEPTAKDAAWALIVAAGHVGTSPADVYGHPTVNRSASWGYKRFAEWRAAGDLIQITEGIHRAADQHLP